MARETGFSVLLATVFHLFINVGNLLFLDVIYQPAFMALSAGVWMIFAGVTVLRRRAMFRSPAK